MNRAFLPVALHSTDPGGDRAFLCRTPRAKGEKIGRANDVPVALAKFFQLDQTGDVGRILG